MSKTTEITKITKEFDREERRLLIVKLLAQQRNAFEGKKHDYNRDMCTLIDLEAGLIVGSGICPKCTYFMGRVD